MRFLPGLLALGTLLGCAPWHSPESGVDPPTVLLRDIANIESCQVHRLERPFWESSQPALLAQDLSITPMHRELTADSPVAQETGIAVRDLADWHRVIAWWFDRYADYAVAVKSEAAYFRDLNFQLVAAEQAEPVFARMLNDDPVTQEERRLVEDHLFWHAVGHASRRGLPVKVHTGVHPQRQKLSLERVRGNPPEATYLCHTAPTTRFIFLHIGYPYWPEMVTVVRHHRNAYLDMSWAWIIDPVASKACLKSYLTAAPASKLLVFGGDYRAIECVVGHAEMARQGIWSGLAELADEGWIDRDDAMELVEPLLHGNAREIFRLEEKLRLGANAPWV